MPDNTVDNLQNNNQDHPAYTRLDEMIARLGGLSPANKALLYTHIYPLQLSRGTYLLREGQHCRQIYFVESGLIRSYQNRDGKDVNLSFSREGSFITHLKSLRTGTPADYSLQTMESSQVWEFSAAGLLECYKHAAELESLGRRIVEDLAIQQEEHIQLFKIHTPAGRYQHIADHEPWLLQRISLTQLSSYLGISRETLSRIRKP